MISNGYCHIARGSRAEAIGNRIMIADSFWTRFRGLLSRSGLEEGEGLLISPCWSIHCLGMKFAIDAIFLDKDYRVVAIHPDMNPGATASNRKARYVLELKAGEAAKHNIQVGEQLRIEPSTR